MHPERQVIQGFHSYLPFKICSKTPSVVDSRVTEDGDPYVRPEDENYEDDYVRQLENELKMEEYLKQKLQDEAYQVPRRHPTPPTTSAPAAQWLDLSHYSKTWCLLLPSTLPFWNILTIPLSP